MVGHVKEKIISSGFSQCPECNYKDGFHIAFKPCGNGKTELILICPACSARFETGWIIDLNN